MTRCYYKPDLVFMVTDVPGAKPESPAGSIAKIVVSGLVVTVSIPKL